LLAEDLRREAMAMEEVEVLLPTEKLSVDPNR
jgi:hypothetical protein